MAVFAGGRKDNESHEVENPSGFTESINIEGKKSGKYNFYLEAKDKGGNTTIAGPDNIYIDPESDLPIVSITNPRANMHVQGHLNIVGTCIDDDAVGFVELWFNDDISTLVRADGAEFWSYFYDTSRFQDKLYSITARGTDINGLPGHETRVVWNLDRKKPETKVTSHELGDLVSGKIRIKGTVWDGNGVETLAYSLDDGRHYAPVSIKYDKKNDIYNWEINVDTKTFKDGPAVIWFQARDKMDTLGATSHLVFVDNTGPDVRVVYPDPATPVNGIFTVAGYAQDTVGLKSLTWKLGKETGEFPLTIGNPWWVKEFDIRGQKASSLDLEIKAVDLSGNVTLAKQKILVDQKADLPVVTLQDPVAGTVMGAQGLTITGSAVDDDGVAAILYAIDGGAPVEIACSGYFQQVITGIPDGTHVLDIWARDITGVEGTKIQVKGIVAPGLLPEPRILAVKLGSGKAAAVEEFYTGKEINPESGAILDLRIDSGSTLASLSYQFGNHSPVDVAIKGSKSGETRQDLAIPADVDYGQVKLTLRVKDIHGREGVWEEYLYITDLSTPNPDKLAAAQDKSSSGGLSLVSIGDTAWSKAARVTIPRGTKAALPLVASISSEQPVSSAIFTVGDRSIKGSAKGSSITAALPADIPAGHTPITLDVFLKSGESYQVSGEFFILRPADDRTINTGKSFEWVRPDNTIGDGRLLISKTSEPIIGLYSGRPLQSVTIAGTGANGLAARIDEYGRVSLQASDIGSFGPVTLTLTDKDGGTFQTSEFRFLVDLRDPILHFNEELEGTWVQNRVQVTFNALDENKISALDFSTNLGLTWTPLLQADEVARLSPEMDITRNLDISSAQDGAVNISIRLTDEAKRTHTRSFTVLKDTQAPQPQLIVPISEARVNGTIRLGIAIKEAGRLNSINYARPAKPVQGSTPAAEAVNRNVYTYYAGNNPLTFLDILLDAQQTPLASDMNFVFEDAAGNRSSLDVWPFIIDQQMDIPVAQISLPLDNEVITTDFVISGIMYDDDAIKQIYWHIDEDEDQISVSTNGYSIPVALSSMTDNEHSVTVVAEDIYGVKSEPVTRRFRISLEEPKASVLLPTFEQIVKGTVRISGVASDKNDISRIQVSLDNGNTYNDAYGTSEWAYQFNSKILKDGTHVVFVRVWDGYNITALYSSLINIDNTPPEVVLDAPIDGASTTGPIYITGRAIDLIQLEDITIELRSLDGRNIPAEFSTRHVKPGSILMEEMNLSTLPDGLYNIEVWAIDKAENTTRVSRNVQLAKDNQRNFVDTLYPLSGEHVQGTFNLYGYVGGIDKASTVDLLVNGRTTATEAVTEAGYYRFSLSGENLQDGLNQLVVVSDFNGKDIIQSEVRSIYYRADGAWVTIDSLNMGDFAYERPWLTGRGGYQLTQAETDLLADKKADKAEKALIQAKKLDYIDISFDNGKTFFKADKGREKGIDWRYRLETGEMAEGLHYLVVRANMANGETAITRTLVQVDKTPPVIRLIAPEAGGRYNQSLEYTALASDDVELKSLTYYLRKGDKSAYEVPGFIQGLYFEFTIPPFMKQIWNGLPDLFAGGATYMDFGMGLSFFDDNVKIQVQYGFMTQDLFESLGGLKPTPPDFKKTIRYGGHVLGLKILANVYTLPFGSFAGPDWDWLSASFAIGANFSLFDIAHEGYTQSGNATWLSALLMQIEFPKVTIPKREYLRTFSFFTEGQLWFIPTDVKASDQGIKTVIPHIVLGLRMYIF
ncbi:BNR domain protein [Leadbettera azotonutricia ZAS-9]|uniref:BNR domain protein n=2 Tax=Leadbettera azotonutricia TaxID=150829 RepID=F5Y8R9_LEAAZ|nr:BNR domain protein [Leadbettera azotonutricia ZAS-9]